MKKEDEFKMKTEECRQNDETIQSKKKFNWLILSKVNVYLDRLHTTDRQTDRHTSS